jgi:hypothetical protein
MHFSITCVPFSFKTWVSLLKLLNARTHLKMTTQLLINTWWIIIHSAMWSQLMTIPITVCTFVCVCVWASWSYTALKVWRSLYLFIKSNNNWSDHLEFWIIVCTKSHIHASRVIKQAPYWHPVLASSLQSQFLIWFQLPDLDCIFSHSE